MGDGSWRTPSSPKDNLPWEVDAGLALALVAFLFLLAPTMPDGDAMDHAGRAVHQGYLAGMIPKHTLYAGLLRTVYLALSAAGLDSHTLKAFHLVSCLAGAGTFLVLARVLYPRFLGGALLSRACAVGTILSFGVLRASSAIEAYAPALFLDTALLAVCLCGDVATARRGLTAGVLFVLAVGFHAANVLLAPFLLLILGRRLHGRPWRAAGWAVGSVLAGACLLAGALLVGAGTWPPEWWQLVPQADPEPAMSPAARAARTVYGVLRTAAWLPPSWELTPRLALAYGSALVLTSVLVLYLARHGFRPGRYRAAWAPAAALVLPLAALGVSYYPSDPERWLFLTPMAWLLVGRIWADYSPLPGARLSAALARAALVSLVVALGLYNVLFGLWPDVRHSRTLEGLQALRGLARPDDLVVTASGPASPPGDLDRSPPFEVLALDRVMLEEYRDDVRGGQQAARSRIAGALRDGRRVLVFGLLHEGLTEGRGYPWAHVAPAGYGPQTFLSLLEECRPAPLVEPSVERAGTYRLTRDPEPSPGG